MDLHLFFQFFNGVGFNLNGIRFFFQIILNFQITKNFLYSAIKKKKNAYNFYKIKLDDFHRLQRTRLP
jgi:hypothetical protein